MQQKSTCLNCKIEITHTNLLRKFCSLKCYREHRYRPFIEKITKTCILCNNQFTFSKNRKYHRKYCSSACYMKVCKPRMRVVGLSMKKYSTEEKRLRDLESGRKSYRKNIEKRLLYYRKLSAIRRGVKGNFTQDEWQRVLENQSYCCNLCKLEMDNPTIDHIIPISRWKEWNKNNTVHYECNNIQNIQALCKSCNSRKHDKV